MREKHPTEASVRVGVKRYLKRLRAEGKAIEWMSVHGDEFTIGEPDIIGCFWGTMFCIELKAPGNTSTKLQLARQAAWRKAGAIVMSDVTDWHQVAEKLGEVC